MLKGGRQELVDNSDLSEGLKKRLLEDKTMIDSINSIDITKLETILSSKLHDWEWNAILFNPKIVNSVNSMDIIKLETILSSKLHDWEWYTILLNPKIVNSVNTLDIERLEIIVKAPKCCWSTILLYEQKMIEEIQSVDMERLAILLDHIMFEKTISISCSHSSLCPHSSCLQVFQCILKSEKVIDVIKSMDIEIMKSVRKLENLLDHVIFELSQEKGPAYTERFKLLFDHNKYDRRDSMKDVLREPDIFDQMTSIDIEKFKLIDLITLREIIQNQKRIDLINCLDIEKFKFIIHYDRTLLRKLWEELPDKIDWNDATNSLNTEGLRFMIEYRNKKVESKNDVIRAESINFIGNEKLWYVVIFDTEWTLLRDRAIKNGIHFFNIEKLKVLLRKCYCYLLLGEILRNEETLKLFQLNSLEKLNITIEAMTDWRKFMAEFKGERDIKKNLNFAIALYKAGLMKKFDCKFLSDNEAVRKAITEAFPRDWIIDQIIMPSGIKEVGPVWNLKSLCLEKLISSPQWYKEALKFLEC